MKASLNELAERLRSSESLSKNQFVQLATSDSLEEQGVLYDALMSDDLASRFVPAVRDTEVHTFLRHYFSRCIDADAAGEWADSRYSACWDAANWLRATWSSLSGAERQRWVSWLASLYLNGSADARLAVETGLLEHIVSARGIVQALRPLMKSEVLNGALRRSKASGRSHTTVKQARKARK